jgi:hypothetical protein
MSINSIQLTYNYLKLRHHLVAAGYVLGLPASPTQQQQARQIAGMLCAECNNWLSCQPWTKSGQSHVFAVCLVCYTATEV